MITEILGTQNWGSQHALSFYILFTFFYHDVKWSLLSEYIYIDIYTHTHAHLHKQLLKHVTSFYRELLFVLK